MTRCQILFCACRLRLAAGPAAHCSAILEIQCALPRFRERLQIARARVPGLSRYAKRTYSQAQLFIWDFI